MRSRGVLFLVLAWLAAGVVAGVRLHLEGGVFGEAVGLAPSVATQLVNGLPWVVAALAAWWAAGSWPVTGDDILRPVTLHAWLGLAVVVIQQLMLAALRATVVPPGLRPLDPWAALPGELTSRAPPALLVYAVLVAAALVWRAGEAGPPQEVPGAGRGVGPSS
jgi:hypothetical protein